MNALILNPFSIFLIATSFISLITSVYVWRRRPAPGAMPLVVLLIGATLWSGGYACELASTTGSTKFIWAGIEWFGVALAPTMLLFLVLQYTGRDAHFHSRHHLLFAIEPISIIILFWTNEKHGLIWQSWDIVFDGNLYALYINYGNGFWFHVVYSYLILIAGVILLTQFYRRASLIYRAQTGVLLAAALIPWLANALYIFDINLFPQLDLTPFAFTLTGLIITWGLFHFKLFNITPVARELIVESMSDGVIVLDTDERIVDINSAAEKIIGLPKDEFIGQSAEILLSTKPDLLGELRDVIQNQTQISLVDGNTKHHFNLRISPLYDRRGNLTGRTVLLEDVTARKAAEEQLRKLSQAVEHSASTIIITNLEAEIEYVNPAFTQTTGYKAEEVLGSNPRILKSGKTPPETYEKMWETLVSGNVWYGEIINKKKNGDLNWETISISPVKNNQGETTHFVAVKDDITIRKQMEEELVVARDRAVEANRLKSRILANISHDMRTPLGSILGYTEMLRKGVFGPITDNQFDILQLVTDSTNHLTEFVNNLLTQSELEAGKLAIQSQPINLEKLILEISSTTNILAEQKGLKFTAIIAPDMPDTILGDHHWLRRILANLTNNAIKFTDKGSVNLSINSVDKEFWTISVTDTGHGIPVEEQAKIFEPFQRGTYKGHTSTGSGLGLTIVKDVTEMMGGRISLSSTVNQGSNFTVLLPLKTP